MKYLILILLASCISQQPKTKTYRYITEKKCPMGTVLYSDDICRPLQQAEPAKIDHYMDFSEIDREIYREMKIARVIPVKIDCKKVLTDINFCAR